jgi:carboxyl-terminal processing protease
MSTYGLPTANQTFALADGALLVLTTAREADRTGRVYDGPIEPDEHVDIDWTALGTPDDPVLATAAEWLVSARD